MPWELQGGRRRGERRFIGSIMQDNTFNFSLKFLRFFGVAYWHIAMLFSFDMYDYDHVCI